MLVSIEGIDGVGKTTCATLLADAEDYIYLHKVETQLDAVIDNAKSNGTNEATLHFLYLFSATSKSNQIRQLISSGQNVIVDRWLGTQVASHRFYCALQGIDPLTLDYNYLNILQPDISFLLTAHDDVRYLRMEKRGNIFGNDLKSLHTQAQEIFRETIRSLNPSVIEIDTTNLTQYEVLEAIRVHIP